MTLPLASSNRGLIVTFLLVVVLVLARTSGRYQPTRSPSQPSAGSRPSWRRTDCERHPPSDDVEVYFYWALSAFISATSAAIQGVKTVYEIPELAWLSNRRRADSAHGMLSRSGTAWHPRRAHHC